MEVLDLQLPGCKLIRAFRSSEPRGSFTKVFSSSLLDPAALGEVFLTSSVQGALRGLHVQEPPAEQHKLVYCQEGVVYDALVDLRAGSPMYGRTHECLLSPEEGAALWVPPGVAHGFLAVEGPAVMLYVTTTAHLPSADRGIRWDSAGIRWPEVPEVLSARDLALPALADYDTPFTHD
jgi:dTDP-4-dehydrorhamnose 3,5-epimerase